MTAWAYPEIGNAYAPVQTWRGRELFDGVPSCKDSRARVAVHLLDDGRSSIVGIDLEHLAKCGTPENAGVELAAA